MDAWLSSMSQMISEPVTAMINTYDHYPLVMALLLGLLGALAPCQLTGNMGAITLYGSRSIQMKENGGEIVAFIIGKVVVFSAIGVLAWLFGQSFEETITSYFPVFRKVIGPLIIATGLVLLGVLKLRFLGKLTSHIPMRLREGRLGSFLLGASFAIAFCPTMFVLFFVWLMPLVTTTSYGLFLPAVFGLATSLPLLLLLLFIWFFDAKRLVMRFSIRAGRMVQRVAGILLIIIGVLDTITYWWGHHA
ncbi:cytochrome C biogenesis protein [Bacillus sp. OxB-1]|uniref:urease accessory protein UreH domain-containing protein n=1 Tax=Bacillus sp. (strain OxB-1) TaxID=98228 RepID=UPI000581C4B1|nr:sulfite exporter TauE/SafE family protein [Bacillus sp. OxB-1]BAQ08571.1 cytochrome C biogenesis protein [Bacillus sp. OxB-1]